jgi:WD40 repeat protein
LREEEEQDESFEHPQYCPPPDGRCAVSASDDYTVKVWNLERSSLIASFSGDSFMISCAIASDGLTIVAGEASGRVHFLRLEGYGLSQESKSHP